MAPIGVEFLAGVVGGAANVPLGHVLLYSLPARIAWYVLQAIFVYQLWALAQPSGLKIKKPTPGRAIGYWFIPFFGLYWMFIMLTNLAKHLNHITGRDIIHVRLVTIGCALFVAGLFAGYNPVALQDRLLYVVLALSGFAGVVIIQINNFYFYRAAKEVCRTSGGGIIAAGK